MKAKDKSLLQNYDSEYKTSSSSELKFYIFCFSILSFCFSVPGAMAKTPPEQLDPIDFLVSHLAKLPQDMNKPNVSPELVKLQPTRQEPSKTYTPSLWEVSNIVPANFVAQVDQNLPQTNFNIAENTDSYLKQQLWLARISAPIIKKDNKNKDELQQLIKQIHSIEFKLQKETSGPVNTGAKLAPITEPNKTPAHIKPPEKPKEKETEHKLPYEPITRQTLQIIRNILQHPDQLENPFELGEVLFLSGHLKEAAAVYKEALKRKAADKAGSVQDRAWILLQIGNCLRDDDLPTAAKTYKQVISEYPDSPWSDLAKAQYKLIDWYLKDKPQTLTAESRPLDSKIENGVFQK